MPANAAVFRKLALLLPNAIESAHMGHPDFRVLCADGKLRIFCTLSGEATSRGVLKLTLDQQAGFCEELPEAFQPVQGGWGRMGMTYVHLDKVDKDTLLGALTTAHRNVTAKVDASKPKVRRMLNAGCMRFYSLTGKESSARINYDSLVEYCDELRVAFLIPARHTRQPGRRLRDDQVLPFPLTETVTVDEVRLLLHCSDRTVTHLIDEGEIQAYRLLMQGATTKWRVNLPSVERYIAKLNRMAARQVPQDTSSRSQSSLA